MQAYVSIVIPIYNEEESVKREKEIKGWSRIKKIKLIESGKIKPV